MVRKIFLGLDGVKDQIQSLKGHNVNLEVNIGRKKLKYFSGKVESVYPSVFTFLDETGVIKTYSYSDILCGDVKIL